MKNDKQRLHDFWNEASCGEKLYLSGLTQKDYEEQARVRYELEPYIAEFADFETAKGQRVLEIGVGLGADHQCFAQAGAELFGIDLTKRAVEYTRQRLTEFGLSSYLEVGDAEQLVFSDRTFDCVYSWGVIHHSPDTPQAISEIWRVLNFGGVARIMIYHKWSLVGVMLWIRYSLLCLRPWRSLDWVYSQYLESPGTKAYTIKQAEQLFSAFGSVEIRTVLTHGDLLEGKAGQRHEGFLLRVARKLWPRKLLKKLFPRMGLFMLITARK